VSDPPHISESVSLANEVPARFDLALARVMLALFTKVIVRVPDAAPGAIRHAKALPVVHSIACLASRITRPIESPNIESPTSVAEQPATGAACDDALAAHRVTAHAAIPSTLV
jgi:hypothetical protein